MKKMQYGLLGFSIVYALIVHPINGFEDITYMMFLILFTVLVGWLGSMFGLNAFYAYRENHLKAHLDKIIVKDVSDKGVPLHEVSRPLEAELLNAGFEHVGDCEVTTVTTPSTINHFYKLDEGQISAAIVGGQVRFFSESAGKALLETAYPYGFDIETPDLRSRSINSSLEQAFAFHQHQMGIFEQMHGELVPHPDMESMIHDDQDRLMRHTLIRIDHFQERRKPLLFLHGLALVIWIATWLYMNYVNTVDVTFMLILGASTFVGLGILYYGQIRESKLYADKRKFQQNQA